MFDLIPVISFSESVKFFITVLALANPIGNLAIFISMTSGLTAKQRKSTAYVTSFSVFVALLLSVWLGIGILSFFGITIGDFQVAGGIVLLLIGLSMINSPKESSTLNNQISDEHESLTKKEKNSIAVVPMAIPMIAGPGSFAAVIVATHNYGNFLDKLILSGEILALSVLVLVILLSASTISKMIGKAGANIATKVMGLIIMSMAVEIVVSGVNKIYPGI